MTLLPFKFLKFHDNQNGIFTRSIVYPLTYIYYNNIIIILDLIFRVFEGGVPVWSSVETVAPIPLTPSPTSSLRVAVSKCEGI